MWIALLCMIMAFIVSHIFKHTPPEPLKIGVIHALTGTMSVSESPMVDAVRLALEEINHQGGLLGQPLEMVLVDSQGDDARAASEAERLITRERVSVLFACWTSSCRKAVKPVVERLGHIMFFSVAYEGMEHSPNIIYTGAAPNQQIIPGAHWAMERFGKRVFLVGSDIIFPRIANVMLRDLIQSNQGEVLAERYLPLGSGAVETIVEEIGRTKPDVVLNTLNGDSNAPFFATLANAGLANLPLVSFSAAEEEMMAWGGGRLTRHYGVWGYFQSLPGEENRRFVTAFQSFLGAHRVTSDPMEATYVGVLLWANAVRHEHTAEPARINSTILHLSVSTPSGIAAVDMANRHIWKMVRVGRVLPDGQFEQVHASTAPMRPYPWPVFRSREEWRTLLSQFAQGEP